MYGQLAAVGIFQRLAEYPATVLFNEEPGIKTKIVSTKYP